MNIYHVPRTICWEMRERVGTRKALAIVFVVL